MDDVVEALATQDEELTGLLAGRSDAEWQRPSPCEGWSVSDVVLHLAQTNELALASVEGRFDELASELARGDAVGSVDDAAALAVARERGSPPAAVLARWRESAAQFLDVVRRTDPHARVQWVAGQLSVHTLVTTRLSETWIHTTDVAEGLGVELPPTERLRHVARIAWRTLPYAFARTGRELHGPVAFELRGPTGVAWRFVPDEPAVTTVRGEGAELCLVAARRLDPAKTSLRTEGPDGATVLELVRTYA